MDGWKRLYFLGIGGIGMSALARYFAERGVEVSGYDRTETQVSRGLVADGIPVYYDTDPARLAGADAVIYTPAIPADFPERVEAERLGLPMYKRAQVLGLISQTKRTIAIAGTHGKTTTSALVAHLLRTGGVDCTAFVGGLMANYHTNYLSGKSDIVVVEADEFDRSFLHLHPETAVLTSVDPDHLDIYGTPEALRDTYSQFLQQIKPGGHLYYHKEIVADSPAAPGHHLTALPRLAQGVTAQSFGVHFGDYKVHPSQVPNAADPILSDFTLHTPGTLPNVQGKLRLPGYHNWLNAAAAAAVALQYGVSVADVERGLASFQGIWRRFQVQYHSPTLTYIDDYAHHPTEMHYAIRTARQLFPTRQLVVVFQPHLFTRTRDFWQEFAHELSQAHVAHIVHIYPARELSIPGITSDLIFQQTSAPEKHLVTLSQVPDQLRQTIRKPTVVLTLGAGDIDTRVDAIRELVQQLDKQG